MPETHRPGVAFGPTGAAISRNTQPRQTSIGSRTRWHAVTHMGASPQKPQHLSPAQIAELKAMMIACLGGDHLSAPHGPSLASLFARVKPPSQSNVFRRTDATQRASLVMSSRRKAQEQAAAQIEQATEQLGSQGYLSPTATAVKQQTQSALAALFANLSPAGGGGSAPSSSSSPGVSLDASGNVNVNLPAPSASANVSF